jgi:hypothetical protein
MVFIGERAGCVPGYKSKRDPPLRQNFRNRKDKMATQIDIEHGGIAAV